MSRKVLIKSLLVGLAVLFVNLAPVAASGIDIGSDNSGLPGLGTINLPTFLSLEQIRSFSVFSYIAFGINMVLVALVLYWVYIVISAAVQIIQAEGDEKKIEEAKKRFGAVFWSISVLFGFVIVLTVVSLFFGLGSFANWPRVLSVCNDGSFYFTKLINNGDALSDAVAEAQCFGGGGGSNNSSNNNGGGSTSGGTNTGESMTGSSTSGNTNLPAGCTCASTMQCPSGQVARPLYSLSFDCGEWNSMCCVIN